MRKDSMKLVTKEWHFQLALNAFVNRGYGKAESEDMARLCEEAAVHGIHSHNLIKALHLDDLFGSRVGGTRPNAEVLKRPSRFATAEKWDAQAKLGPSVGWSAIERCMEMADKLGVGIVTIDNAWHYLWGGAYVLAAARRGYFAYTNCTAMLAEVAPHGGKHPALGTNPHSWALPTEPVLGFPILVDWATSMMAMGRIQQLQREGMELPKGVALDEQGEPTTDPAKAKALLPFARHKGFGLGLLNELFAAWIGGNLPTQRGQITRAINPVQEKRLCTFFFQVIHPDAITGGSYAQGRTLEENLRSIVQDIKGHGNQDVLLPGELEARHAELTREKGGLIFTEAELMELREIERGLDYEL